MLKIAVIGLGWWGSTIIKCLQESNIVEIYAAVDIDEKRGNFICSKYNLRYYKNIEDALGDIDVDAVIIATAHGLHEEMFISSLEANKHIFCEKPFAFSSKAAKRMITGAESKGIIIGILYLTTFTETKALNNNIKIEGKAKIKKRFKIRFSYIILRERGKKIKGIKVA